MLPVAVRRLRDMKKQGKGVTLAIRDIALIGMMAAVMEVSKISLSFLFNIELVSFWIILFTLFFGRRIWIAIMVFNLMEAFLYGIGIWWIGYLYAWPILAMLTYLFRRQGSVWFWSILSSMFGLMFGLLFTIPYVVAGAVGNGLRSGIYAGFTWWVAGIRADIIHAVGNFVLMLALYQPIRRVMKRLAAGMA